MTDERLDQILKQALTPAIKDSEIQIHRKVGSKKMNVKKIVVTGLAACAAIAFAVTGGMIGGFPKIGNGNNAVLNNRQDSISGEQTMASNNIFAITAYAAELPDDISSGDVIDIRIQSGYGSFRYLDGRFTISGQNIERISVTTDQCELYTALPVYRTDPDFENLLKSEMEGLAGGDLECYEPVMRDGFANDYDVNDLEQRLEDWIDYFDHLKVVGQSYEGAYNEHVSFGMSVPESLWSTNDDPQESYHEAVDRVDGATITITVTFTDGSTQEHSYRLQTGKIYLPGDADGNLQWDSLTRFLTDEESKTETPHIYGYLLEKIE